jgi:Tripartite tricarboxylate transporter TctB family
MEDEKPSAFADLVTGAVWLVVAAAIIIGSWRMDRLEHLSNVIYTAPGLVPGLIGSAIALMAVLLMVRAVRRGALSEAHWPAIKLSDHWRLIAALILCLGFSVGLIGRGLRFWVAAAIFIAVFVFVFQFPERRAAGTLTRGAAIAVVFAGLAAFAIHTLFQDVFLVRLP